MKTRWGTWHLQAERCQDDQDGDRCPFIQNKYEQISYCTNLNFGFAQLEWTFAPVSLHWFYKLMPVESWHIPPEKGSIYIPSKQTETILSLPSEALRQVLVATVPVTYTLLKTALQQMSKERLRKQLSEDVRICASAGKCWDKIRNILQGQSSAKEWLVSDAFFRDRRLQHTNRCHF